MTSTMPHRRPRTAPGSSTQRIVAGFRTPDDPPPTGNGLAGDRAPARHRRAPGGVSSTSRWKGRARSSPMGAERHRGRHGCTFCSGSRGCTFHSGPRRMAASTPAPPGRRVPDPEGTGAKLTRQMPHRAQSPSASPPGEGVPRGAHDRTLPHGVRDRLGPPDGSGHGPDLEVQRPGSRPGSPKVPAPRDPPGVARVSQ